MTVAQFRITVQDARVVEISYDLELPAGTDPVDAIEHFLDLAPEDQRAREVHRETIQSNWEATGAEEMS